MAGIFINYRRDDAPGVAGRLYDHLAKDFARRDLFMDVDAIKPGLDFIKQLDAHVSQCHVLLALIGRNWLAVKDKDGAPRLHGDRDYVRVELASALKRDIPVIPVLIDGAEMPSEEGLPDDLKSLARRHALELRHTRFAADADAIVFALKGYLPPPKKRWVWPVAAGCLVAVGLGATLYFYFKSAPKPSDSPATTPAAMAPSVSPPKEVAACPSTENYGPPPTAETELTRVNCFAFFSLSGDRDPGLRIWEREIDGTWTEAYPSGFSEKGIQERARANVSGCRGSIVGPADEPEHAVFIPDKGCPGMMVLFRNGPETAHWHVLAPMQVFR
jgi:hypothetical protein